MSQRYSGVIVLLAALAVSKSAHADAAARTNAPAAVFEDKALTETGLRELIEAAAWLRQHPGGQIVLEGNSDDQGRARGHAARDLLLSLGVMPGQIVALPLGEPLTFPHPWQPAPPRKRIALTACATAPTNPTIGAWDAPGGSSGRWLRSLLPSRVAGPTQRSARAQASRPVAATACRPRPTPTTAAAAAMFARPRAAM